MIEKRFTEKLKFKHKRKKEIQKIDFVVFLYYSKFTPNISKLLFFIRGTLLSALEHLTANSALDFHLLLNCLKSSNSSPFLAFRSRG